MTAGLPHSPCAPVAAELDEFEELGPLRRALERIAPEGTLRFVLLEISLVSGGRPAGTHRVLDAVLDAEGNLLPLSLRERADADEHAAAEIRAALRDLGLRLDRLGWAGRDGTEVILDADGGRQVRLVLGAEISPEEADAERGHPAIHDGDHHVRHRAFELDALRDRVQEQHLHPLRRWTRRVRARVTRRD